MGWGRAGFRPAASTPEAVPLPGPPTSLGGGVPHIPDPMPLTLTERPVGSLHSLNSAGQLCWAEPSALLRGTVSTRAVCWGQAAYSDTFMATAPTPPTPGEGVPLPPLLATRSHTDETRGRKSPRTGDSLLTALPRTTPAFPPPWGDRPGKSRRTFLASWRPASSRGKARRPDCRLTGSEAAR